MTSASLLRSRTRVAVRKAAYGVISVLGLLSRLTRAGKREQSGTALRLLVVRLDLLGDVLLTMSGVQALRRAYPDANIWMLTLPYTAPLAKLYRCVDEVVTVDTNRIRTLNGILDPRTWSAYWHCLRRLRAQRFDVAISVSGRMASLCAFLIGAQKVIGYEAEAYPYLLSDPVPGGRYLTRQHETEYVLGLAQQAGGDARPRDGGLIKPEIPRLRKSTLESIGANAFDKIVLLHAGSVNGSAKRWPPDHWALLASRLHERCGVQPILVGAHSDLAISDAVMEGAHGSVVSLVDQTSVDQLVALIARADLLVTGDSGPMHIAVAVGTPLIAVFGPTDPAVYGPYRPVATTRVLRKDLPCSPCYTLANTAECPLGDPICMRLVTVDTVLASALKLLGMGRSTVG